MKLEVQAGINSAKNKEPHNSVWLIFIVYLFLLLICFYSC